MKVGVLQFFSWSRRVPLMRTFAVNPDNSAERYRECVDIVLKAREYAPVSHQRKYWQCENVDVLPKPLQNPQPSR